ncbi:MAG: hypothetical protein ACT4OK_04230 [Gemmobacter sp.]
MIGHNDGPTMEPGAAWRRHCWTQARDRLLPHLPIEVLRGRLRRAADLGLDYRAYAGIRAATGHDVVAVLFSSNALAAHPLPAPDRLAKLAAIGGAQRIGLATRPLAAPALLQAADGALDAAHAAPDHLARWSDARATLRRALGRTPGDRAILIGAHLLEAEWCAAGGLAGYLPETRYFAGP